MGGACNSPLPGNRKHVPHVNVRLGYLPTVLTRRREQSHVHPVVAHPVYLPKALTHRQEQEHVQRVVAPPVHLPKVRTRPCSAKADWQRGNKQLARHLLLARLAARAPKAKQFAHRTKVWRWDLARSSASILRRASFLHHRPRQEHIPSHPPRAPRTHQRRQRRSVSRGPFAATGEISCNSTRLFTVSSKAPARLSVSSTT